MVTQPGAPEQPQGPDNQLNHFGGETLQQQLQRTHKRFNAAQKMVGRRELIAKAARGETIDNPDRVPIQTIIDK